MTIRIIFQAVLLTFVLLVSKTAGDPEDLSQPQPGVDQHFYPYGIPNGDQIAPPADDDQMALSMDSPFHVVNRDMVNLRASPNGFFYFFTRSGHSSALNQFRQDLRTDRYPHISFLGMRQTEDAAILQRASHDINTQYGELTETFTAAAAIISTLHKASSFSTSVELTATVTVQTVLVRDDAGKSFAIFNYGDVMQYGCDHISFQPNWAYNIGNMYLDPLPSYQELQSHRVIFRLDAVPIPEPVIIDMRNGGTGGDAATVRVELCVEGTFSETGEQPCMNCSRGQYQNSTGESSCFHCPNGQTTQNEGATSQDECFGSTTVVGDPHFLITNPSDKEHFCFDVGGKEGDVLPLISDPNIELNVEGSLFEVHLSQINQTYFSTIQITFGDQRILFTREGISCNDDSISWNSKEVYVSGSVVLRPVEERDTTIMVEINGGDVGLLINKHVDDVGSFLGIFIANSEGLSDTTQGIIGQFVHHEFKILQHDEESFAHLKFSNREAIVPVSQRVRFNPSHHNTVDCWLYEPKEGERHEILNL